jgi:hypothetical protein
MLVDTFSAFREPFVVCSYNRTLKIPKSDAFVVVSLGLNEVIRDSKFVVRRRVAEMKLYSHSTPPLFYVSYK